MVFGKNHTQESREKMSLARRGTKFPNRKRIKLSEEHKINIGKGNKGKVRSEEAKENYKKANNSGRFKKGDVRVSGKNHWCYIDGRSKFLTTARYGDDWDKIRMLVYLRDKFTCQECGITANESKRALHIHHKNPFLISFDNSLKNLITLCPSCHRKIDAQIIKQIKIGV